MEVEPETEDTPPSTTNITSDPASSKSKLSETKRSPRESSLNASTESVRRQSPRGKTTNEPDNDTTSTEPLIVVGGRRGRKSVTPTLRASTTPSSPSEAVLVKKSRKEKSRAELDVSSIRYEVSM